MNRRLLFTLISLQLAAGACMAEAYLESDFSSGIPEGFAVYDNDGLEPSVDMARLGFEKGKGWIAVQEDKDGNMAACSTSWYKTPGTSDDWLVTPEFTVTDQDAVLRWRGRAYDAAYADGYKVLIQTAPGGTPAEFTDAPVFSIAAESGEWTDHEVNLASYEGQTVRVAFVNNSTDRSRLYIDDLFAGVVPFLNVATSVPSIVTVNTAVPLTVVLSNPGKETFKGNVELELECDGATQTCTLTGVNLEPNASAEFETGMAVPTIPNNCFDYTISLKSGDRQASRRFGVTALVNRVLCEEMTGMWCGYCVRGIVNMEEMKRLYPDTYIGIAIHSADDLSVAAYAPLVSRYTPNGFPAMIMMRNPGTKGDPSKIGDYYKSLIGRAASAGVELKAGYDAETGMINADAELCFAKDEEDASYKMCYVVIENNISDPSYFQKNEYSGSDTPMGGWENLPEVVRGEGLKFQDCARGIALDALYGIDDSVPTGIKALEKLSHSVEFPMPEVKDSKEVEVVAMLLDGEGKIVNACKAALGTKGSGIESIDAEDAEIVSVSWFDPSGYKVSTPRQGIYLKRTVYSNGAVKTIKVIK